MNRRVIGWTGRGCGGSKPGWRWGLWVGVWSLLAGAAAWGSSEGVARPGDPLEAGFRSPPAEARPWVYWFWMDGNVSREGITADLEAMARVGIGGMILMEVDVGIPRGSVGFMGAEWRGLFGHAVREAERLGLEITLNAGPGWTGSGGPWVRPGQSMQHLVVSEVEVAGPGRFSGDLPRPRPRAPHFVHAPLPPGVREAWEGFYEDVAVLAFPTPARADRIPGVDEKALYYRLPYSSHPGVPASLPAPVEFPEVAAEARIPVSRVLDLTPALGRGGRLEWADVPPGRWTVQRWGRASTGANTRPAPGPGIGLECDKFDAEALEAHFDAYIGTLLRELGRGEGPGRGVGWTQLHIDSWEMGAQNWTGRFADEFRSRRGYSPIPYLPAMAGRVVGSVEESERFLWDLRQTAQELVVQHHAGRLKGLGRRYGLGLSIEPYDMNPCADLTLGGEADVPMGEFWSDGFGFDTAFSVVEAVSIGHTRGRRVVGAEAFTSTEEEAWRLHPGRMKAQADWAFAQGVSRLVIHRFAHQPWLDRRPGMTMGPYGVHHDRTQTWWEMSGTWHAYLARCQFLARQGDPVADLCYLNPEGAPQVFRPPPSASTGRAPMPDRRGWGWDGCAPEVLLGDSTVEDGRLVLSGSARYRLLVLPERDTMTPRLLARVKALVEAGAVVLGRPPRRSPGLSGHPGCDAEVAALAEALWGPEAERRPGRVRVCGRGRVVASSGVPEGGEYVAYDEAVAVLRDLGVPPDFESDEALRFAHRRVGATDLYFVANREGRFVRVPAWFRVAGRSAEIWDPRTGGMREAAEVREEGGRTRVELALEGYGSRWVVFRPGVQPASGETRGGKAAVGGGAFFGTVVPGPWTVEFPVAAGGVGALPFGALVSWSEHADPRVRDFSGTAVYRAELELPADPGTGGSLWLDLGRVEVMARVRLNGTELGVTWAPPHRVELTPAMRGGSNRLEIEVVNLWPNRLMADAGEPPERRVTWTAWNPYRPDGPRLPSGLLGPVVWFPVRSGGDPMTVGLGPGGGR